MARHNLSLTLAVATVVLFGCGADTSSTEELDQLGDHLSAVESERDAARDEVRELERRLATALAGQARALEELATDEGNRSADETASQGEQPGNDGLAPSVGLNCTPLSQDELAALQSTLTNPDREVTDGFRIAAQDRSGEYLAARQEFVLDAVYVFTWVLPEGSELESAAGARAEKYDLEDRSPSGTMSVADIFVERAGHEWSPLDASRDIVADCVLLAVDGIDFVRETFTLEHYDSLRVGSHSLDDVLDIVPAEACTESVETQEGLVLTCRGVGMTGANAVLHFQGDILIEKAQFGLD